MVPPMRIIPNFFLSLSHQEASISLLSFSIRGQTTENHNHRKLTDLITWTTALSNSMKLWAMPCGATQDGWIMVECSDKVWSTGEGNVKPLQYSCFGNPIHEQYEKAKRQDTERWTPQVGRCPICYWRRAENSSRQNEEAEPKQTQCPDVEVPGGESKVQCC